MGLHGQGIYRAVSHNVKGPAPWIARTVPAAFCRLNAISARFIVSFTSRRVLRALPAPSHQQAAFASRAAC